MNVFHKYLIVAKQIQLPNVSHYNNEVIKLIIWDTEIVWEGLASEDLFMFLKFYLGDFTDNI